jgi:hypothetical protein
MSISAKLLRKPHIILCFKTLLVCHTLPIAFSTSITTAAEFLSLKAFETCSENLKIC